MGSQYKLVCLAQLLLATILTHACSLEERKSRQIRAHTVKYDGVEHGFNARYGPRYCKECHGASLEGGEGREPSCFQCHGLNWSEIDPETSRAPEDHTSSQRGFRHHPNLNSPAGYCSNCHGSELEGDTSLTTPACLLCHEQKW